MENKLSFLSKTQKISSTTLKHGYLLKNSVAIVLLKMIDLIGGIIFSLKPKRPFIKNPRKILITKIDHLGDVILSLHVLSIIKKSFPKSEIHYVCGSWSQSIVQNNPLIDKVFIFDHFKLNRNGTLFYRIQKMVNDFFTVVPALRKEQYDLAIDFRGYFPNFIPILAFCNVKFKLGYAAGGFGFVLDHQGEWKEGIHETEHFLDLLKAVIPSPKREKVSLDYLTDIAKAQQILDGYQIYRDQPFILIHAFCQQSPARTFKHWRIEEWQKLIRSLTANGQKVICTGDIHDAPLIHEIINGTSAIDCSGQTPIPVLAGLIKQSQCVITIDTFVSHLSAALNQKTIVLFQQVESVEQWKPWGDFVTVVPLENDADKVISILSKLESVV